MNINFLKGLTCIIILLYITLSCTQIDLPKETNGKDLEVRKIEIITKSTEDIEIPYPIIVYAINDAGETVNKQEIKSESENLSLSLSEGKYTIVAFAGTDGYIFPESGSSDNKIRLSDNESLPVSALMSGKANVSISNKDVNITLMMSYCVSKVKMQLNNIPVDAEEVSITLSPLYASMDLQGNHYDENNVYTVMAEYNSVNDSWETPDFHCFGNNGNQLNISIGIKRSESQINYGHKIDTQLQPNTPYYMSGNYNEGFFVNGNFEYQGWNPPVEIDFDFGENSDNTDNNPTFEIDKVPCIWNGHIVLDVSVNEQEETEIMLLSSREWSDVYSAYNEDYPDECISIAKGYSEGDISSGWEVPSVSDGKKIFTLLEDNDFTDKVNSLLEETGGDILYYSDAYDYNNNKIRYLYDEGRKTFSVGSDGTTSTAGKSRTYNLRLIYKIRN